MLQQDTPPLHSGRVYLCLVSKPALTLHLVSYAYSQAQDPATPPVARRPSDVGSLSPSEGVSLRKQSRPHKLPQRKAPSMSSHQQAAANPSLELTREPPVVNGIQLVSPRQALPDNLFFQSIFPYSVFNAVQSKCFESVYGSSDNLVVSAPTGSGKTAIFELAICKIVADRGPENIKIVYQAPTKALCSERARDWQKKFSPLKLECAELTGDTSQAEMRRVGGASIIVTTPEKWDSITRKWHDHRKLLQLVALFLIDEVHILKDIRGATLEAVVSRMKSIGTDVRFVALSATIPNSEDIATWLGLNHQNQHLPARRETFGDEFRPVKLERHVFGFEKRTNDHVFDKFLDSKLPPLLAKHTCGKPILIFCFTRKSCENIAAKLAEWWTSLPEDGASWHKPANPIRVIGRELQELVKTGVAFHHAGLVPDDRQAIEQAFLKGDLSVICCTSTLAVGVNLPCHTVVLKGTVTYQNDSIHELSDLEALQMLGRAGRPQFDDSANALILTSSDQKERYVRMVSGEEILESTLHLNLIEHLNSEVGLRTITDVESAKKWLAGTFLAVRLRKNPNYYRLAEGTSTAKSTDSMLEEICERDIKLLQEYKIVTRDEVFKQTAYGGSMSRYMVEFNTMKLLLELPRAMNTEQLVSCVL
jgi:ATP-dependent DNA helicase HFM1/MER3